jgi:hypothetical protein
MGDKECRESKSSVTELALALRKLYSEPFGAKNRGRYQITKKRLAQLARRKFLSQELLSKLATEMLEDGFFLLDRYDYVVVLAIKVTKNYRRVPDTLIDQYLGKAEEDSDLGESAEDEE